MPRSVPSPQSVAASRFPPADEGELNLYYLHSFLLDLKRELIGLQELEPEDVVDTFRYLKAKDPERAAIVNQRISMATLLMSDAAELVSECMHWANVEAQFCPVEEAEEFHDTPQNWFAVARGQIKPEGHSSNGASAPPTPEPPPKEAPEAAPESTAVAMPLQAPSSGALRRHARTLRSECEREKRRFYAIAGKHGLPTGREAGQAIRDALAQLFERPIQSRTELSAMDWSKAASALETDDLTWEVPGYEAPNVALDGIEERIENGASANGHYNGAPLGKSSALRP
jgi:hypothetical protein